MFGLRSAWLTFEKGNSSITVHLFPMVHVGEQRFYDETFAEASRCDVILFEGIKSDISRNLSRTYRWLSLEKLDLVVQPRLTHDVVNNARMVHADLESDEFHREWKSVPLYQRIAFFVLAPLYGIWQRTFASRESLAKNMALDDLASSDEILRWSPDFEAFSSSIGDARDKRLIEVLDREIVTSSIEGKAIGIVYGARHMRPVIRHLTERGFRTGKAKWTKIFGLSMDANDPQPDVYNLGR